jgi:YidC/Oxa1 family membrane protein insertase
VSPLDLLSPVLPAVHSALISIAAALPGAPGVQLLGALVLVTFGVRALLLPLAVHGFRRRREVAALQPQLNQVRRKHRNDPERLVREMGEVYRDAGLSPMAGMGSGLLQAPLLLTLYGLATTPQIGGGANQLLTAHVLGTPLSSYWLPVVLSGPFTAPVLALVGMLAALASVAYLSSRQQQEGPRWLRLVPYGTVVFAVASPVALSVYLLSTTTWSLAERAALSRWG